MNRAVRRAALGGSRKMTNSRGTVRKSYLKNQNLTDEERNNHVTATRRITPENKLLQAVFGTDHKGSNRTMTPTQARAACRDQKIIAGDVAASKMWAELCLAGANPYFAEYGIRNPASEITDGVHRAWIEATETLTDASGKDVELFYIEIIGGKFITRKLHDVVRIKFGSEHDHAKRRAYHVAVGTNLSSVNWNDTEELLFREFLIDVIDGVIVGVAPDSKFTAFPAGATSSVAA
ncbi:hypothetical protein N8E89_09180 [Phyllobacterium sp. A18/5-2]|uniref:hypothetical protein n=1 Tax=Phyllobacterium sp. A18/5-2 TaxID=2978392 RepID=UPI0021C6435F|nr:hypothetical protein [Phyllobacterium sp. A18/5-2]UXN62888.1 hypothetical protein N8E89_09180 [Phyllobacterium sp. A18/5-2]